MNDQIRTAVNQIDGLVGDIKGMIAEPVKPVELTLMQKIRGLADQTAPRKGLPLAVVNFRGKTLGVFWKGEGKTGAPTVGLRKLVKSGRLHAGHRRFAPAYWVAISDLPNHGN